MHSKGKNVSVGSFELIKEFYLLRTRAVIHNQNELRYNSFPFLKDLDELSFENWFILISNMPNWNFEIDEKKILPFE